jgi:hypothetical protein
MTDIEEGADELKPLLPKGRYKVTIDLSQNEGEEGRKNLGLSFDHRTLVVRSVIPGGAVSEWNDDHPAFQVEPGDRIESANGEGTLACRVVKKMRDVDTVRLVLTHAGSTSDEAKPRSLYDRLFQADMNPDFAKQCELSLRAGVFVLLSALPFLVPAGFSPTIDWVKKEKYFGSLSVVFFFFTFYRSTL